MTDTKTGKAARRIEMIANIAIILAACVLILIFIQNRTKLRTEQPAITPGANFALKEINWQVNRKNLVLALSTDCRFCNESAGFYRELVQHCKEQGIRTIAIFPQSVSDADFYLKSKGVAVDELRQSILGLLDIHGTPTLLLVDNTGIVKHVWIGKLPPQKQTEVLAALGL